MNAPRQTYRAGTCLAAWRGSSQASATWFFDRGETEPELLLERSGEDSAHGLALPPGRARHLFDPSG
jgi:hypothetical protein